MMRPLLIAALGAALLVPRPLEAQHGRFPRRILVALAGGVLAGSAAGLYAALRDPQSDQGGCSSSGCVVPVTVAGGVLIGFMIGREMDQLYGLRYRTAPPIRLRGRELPLSIVPTDVWYDARTVLVPGEDAMELVRADESLSSLGVRARGLRGMGPATASAERNTLFVGTPVGLYRFQLAGDQPGTLAHAEEVSAVAQAGSQLALGTGPDVSVLRVRDSLEALGDPVFESGRVVDLVWETNQLWVLTEDRLAAYNVTDDGLTEAGSHEFIALARRVHLSQGMAAVALGSSGVMVLDVRNPAAPREVGTWSGARFAYDVVIRGTTMYVAAGPEGLYVLEIGANGITPRGLARDMGFIAALASDDEALYVLDRTGGRLRRIAFLMP
jgi:hypothetical protein